MNALAEKLIGALGHETAVAVYGNELGPCVVCLEDMDTNELLLDSEAYDIVPVVTPDSVAEARRVLSDAGVPADKLDDALLEVARALLGRDLIPEEEI